MIIVLAGVLVIATVEKTRRDTRTNIIINEEI